MNGVQKQRYVVGKNNRQHLLLEYLDFQKNLVVHRFLVDLEILAVLVLLVILGFLNYINNYYLEKNILYLLQTWLSWMTVLSWRS